jgi:hypothetical protein
MFEGARHSRDLGGAGADGLGDVPPCRGHGRDLLDDRAGLRQRMGNVGQGELARKTSST